MNPIIRLYNHCGDHADHVGWKWVDVLTVRAQLSRRRAEQHYWCLCEDTHLMWFSEKDLFGDGWDEPVFKPFPPTEEVVKAGWPNDAAPQGVPDEPAPGDIVASPHADGVSCTWSRHGVDFPAVIFVDEAWLVLLPGQQKTVVALDADDAFQLAFENAPPKEK
jgi:hypothetical protein